MGKTNTSVAFGALDDPGASLFALRHVNTTVLDALAALFPFMFVVLAIAQDQLGVWTRIFYCFFMLAIGKGLFGWLTILPASDGWAACKDRLKDNADWYAEKHNVAELFFMNPAGRVCADMMWSGHTYFVTIFALGLYELSGNTVRNWPRRWQQSVQLTIGSLAVLQQAVEIFFVLSTRFHYSMDIVMAIIMTFLLYTNSFIAVLSKDWVTKNNEVDVCSSDPNEIAVKLLQSDGDLFLPGIITACGACCLSHGHFGNQHIYHSDDMMEIFEKLQTSGLHINMQTKNRLLDQMNMPNVHGLEDGGASPSKV